MELFVEALDHLFLQLPMILFLAGVPVLLRNNRIAPVEGPRL